MSTPERPVDDQNRTERGQSRGGVRGVLNELLHGRDDVDRPADEARTGQTPAGHTHADGRPVPPEAGQPIPGAPGYRDPAGPQHAAAPAQHGGPVGGAPAGGVPAGGGSALPQAPGPQVPGQQVPGQQGPGPAGGVRPDQSYGNPQEPGRPGPARPSGADVPRGVRAPDDTAGAGAAGTGAAGTGAAGVGTAGIAAAGATHAAGSTDRRERADDTGRPVGGSEPAHRPGNHRPTAQHATEQHAAEQHATEQHATEQHATDGHDPARHAIDRPGRGHAAGAGTPAGPSSGEDAAGRERLVPAARAQEYGARWDAVKGTFVDEPRQAVQQADVLVGELLDELERLFRDQRRGLEQGLDADETSTEDLRLALRRYRSFFDRLLSL